MPQIQLIDRVTDNPVVWYREKLPGPILGRGCRCVRCCAFMILKMQLWATQLMTAAQGPRTSLRACRIFVHRRLIGRVIIVIAIIEHTTNPVIKGSIRFDAKRQTRMATGASVSLAEQEVPGHSETPFVSFPGCFPICLAKRNARTQGSPNRARASQAVQQFEQQQYIAHVPEHSSSNLKLSAPKYTGCLHHFQHAGPLGGLQYEIWHCL